DCGTFVAPFRADIGEDMRGLVVGQALPPRNHRAIKLHAVDGPRTSRAVEGDSNDAVRPLCVDPIGTGQGRELASHALSAGLVAGDAGSAEHDPSIAPGYF